MIAASALALIVIALALGAFSSAVFVWQWVIGAPTQVSVLGLLVLVGAGAAAVWWHLTRRIPSPTTPSAGYWLLGLAAAVGGYSIVRYVTATRLGGADAWGIWNLHALFLYRGASGDWTNLFDPALWWSHNDYPLLLPALVNAGWTAVGSESEIVSALVSLLFGALIIGIVCSAACVIARDQRGWIAALVVLGTPTFLLQSAAQMADVPLAVYILITVVLLAFAEEWPGPRTELLALTGFSAGLAAWTKNEGLVLVGAVIVTHLVLVALRSSWHTYYKEAAALGVGLAPLVLLVVSFKTLLAPPGDIQLNAAAIVRLAQMERYVQIAKAFASHIVSFGYMPGGTHPAVLMGLYAVLYIPPARGVRYSSIGLLLLPLLLLGSYFAVYVISPHDLEWHLSSSLERLLIHVWPSVIFILAVVPRPAVVQTPVPDSGFHAQGQEVVVQSS